MQNIIILFRYRQFVKKGCKQIPAKPAYIDRSLVVVPENISLYKFTLSIYLVCTAFYQLNRRTEMLGRMLLNRIIKPGNEIPPNRKI